MRPSTKDYILPLVFAKRLCDVFDDEVNRISEEVGSREKAFKLVKADWNQVKDKKKAMLHFSVPNHGKLWKSLMMAHLGDYQRLERRMQRASSG